MKGFWRYGQLVVRGVQWFRRYRQVAVCLLAALGCMAAMHLVQLFTQPANSMSATPPYSYSLGNYYADTNAYYCARYAALNDATAAACRASAATAALLAAQMQPGGSAAHDCRAYDALFRQYSWNANLAEAICQAESGGNPDAVSPTNDYGLMQLHNLAVFDPAQNIAMAYVKYQVQGWGAWTTYNTGAYNRYL